MIKKLIYLFFFSTLPLFSDEYVLPTVIDFGTFPKIEAMTDTHDAWNLGCCAFNFAPEITPVFAFLKYQYHIDTVVETGTFLGSTTLLFALLFDNVHTIENNINYYQHSKERLQKFSNVQCHLGSSEEILKGLLPSLKGKPVIYYLDAHWNEFWPLLSEIEEIGKTHKDNCIIVIDDFKVPGRSDIPYDAYGTSECSYEYIEKSMSEIFSSYEYYYVIPDSPSSRAKFVAIPTKWL